jgi:hypothetical protein
LREILFTDRPQSGRLLEELFRGKGAMKFMDAYAAIAKPRGDPDRAERLAREGIDEERINKRVKSAVSHLRTQLWASMRSGRFNIIKYEPGTGKYRLLLPIGVSVPRLDAESRCTGEYEFMSY